MCEWILRRRLRGLNPRTFVTIVRRTCLNVFAQDCKSSSVKQRKPAWFLPIIEVDTLGPAYN